MPPWADRSEIQKFYDLARDLTVKTGIPHDVDHIIPIQGKLVVGLHLPINLRVIPAKVNRSKGARIDLDAIHEEIGNGLFYD
jgi:hypothetical protein